MILDYNSKDKLYFYCTTFIKLLVTLQIVVNNTKYNQQVECDVLLGIKIKLY